MPTAQPLPTLSAGQGALWEEAAGRGSRSQEGWGPSSWQPGLRAAQRGQGHAPLGQGPPEGRQRQRAAGPAAWELHSSPRALCSSTRARGPEWEHTPVQGPPGAFRDGGVGGRAHCVESPAQGSPWGFHTSPRPGGEDGRKEGPVPESHPTNELPTRPVPPPRLQMLPGSSCLTCGPARSCRVSSDR